MYFLYNLILIFFAMLLSPVILVLFIISPKLRAGFFEKIGFYSKKTSKKKSIWVHAVSVGEVNAIETVFKRLKSEFPEHNLVLTTVTRTGQAIANSKLGKVADVIAYFPYDFSFSVNSAIKSFNPELAIIAETEIWPMFAHKINKAGIPLAIINGRISPNSYKGYKKFKYFFKKIFKNYKFILMQSQGDRERIINIGANPEITKVMGNLKFDINKPIDENAIEELKNYLKITNQKVIIAGSTHKGEDEIILNAYSKLKKDNFDLKLLIAPRHPERHQSVFRLVSNSGFSYGSRKNNDNFEEKDIIIIDTIGELGKLYSVSDVAFIGGSFSGTGGHNPLEPAIFGTPVVSGPTVFNFKDIYKIMSQNGSAFIVETEEELENKISLLLNNFEVYQQASNECYQIFEQNKGAIETSIKYFKEILNK